MSIATQLRGAYTRRRQYNRTVRAIRALPLDIALDLDIDRSEAAKIARRAVYG